MLNDYSDQICSMTLLRVFGRDFWLISYYKIVFTRNVNLLSSVMSLKRALECVNTELINKPEVTLIRHGRVFTDFSMENRSTIDWSWTSSCSSCEG